MTGQAALGSAEDYIIVGELSLDGSVKRVKGMLSMAICARDLGARGMIVPRENAEEAAVAEGNEYIDSSAFAETSNAFEQKYFQFYRDISFNMIRMANE